MAFIKICLWRGKRKLGSKRGTAAAGFVSASIEDFERLFAYLVDGYVIIMLNRFQSLAFYI